MPEELQALNYRLALTPELKDSFLKVGQLQSFLKTLQEEKREIEIKTADTLNKFFMATSVQKYITEYSHPHAHCITE